uniref:Uncharacterized protein n=1 Tax=Arundo donax TaxID=35708 RepID=A0A0A9B4E7_ARUDO
MVLLMIFMRNPLQRSNHMQ